MYCCVAVLAAVLMAAPGPQRAAVHPHLIIFHLVYGCTPSWPCLHLPPCMEPVSLRPSQRVTQPKERERGREGWVGDR